MISRSNCIESLQEAALVLGESPTATQYRELDISPSVGYIIKTFGKWNNAKDEAKLEHREPTYNVKSVNLDYFKEIETDEQAYWLGFIYGDGCIRTGDRGVLRLQLALAQEDAHHVKAFKSAVESEHQLNYIEREGNTQNQLSIVISRRDFVENLVEHGADSSKTHSDSLPDLDGDLQAPFVRGLYDADGSLKSGSWKITGSNRERFQTIGEWLPVESSIYEAKSDEGVWFDLYVPRDELEPLAQFLYPEGDETEPSLSRKHL